MKKLWAVIGAGAVLALFSLLFFRPALASIPTDFINPCIYNEPLFNLHNEEGMAMACDNHGRLIMSPSSTVAISSSTAITAVISATSSISVTPSYPAASTTLTFIYDNSAGEDNIKASAGRLHSFFVSNRYGSTLYVQFFNTSTIPSAGATPVLTYAIGGNGQMIVDASYFTYLQKYFSNGIAIGISSTFGTYTATANFSYIDLMGEYD